MAHIIPLPQKAFVDLHCPLLHSLCKAQIQYTKEGVCQLDSVAPRPGAPKTRALKHETKTVLGYEIKITLETGKHYIKGHTQHEDGFSNDLVCFVCEKML